MFAVIRTGGKQYRVAEGDRLQVEKLPGEPGEAVTFDEVLLLGGERAKVGTPLVKGAKVQAEIVDQGRDPKIIVFKLRRRKKSRCKAGHRQPYTEVRITQIKA